MTDVMDTVKLPANAMRPGPIRASALSHPRMPRHLLLKLQQGEAGEQKVGGKLADQGDSNAKQQAALPERKELSAVERHQLQAPAQMLAQLKRNSLGSGGPLLPTLTSTPLSQDRATSPAQSQGPSSGNTPVISQHSNRAEPSEQNGISAKRRQQMIDSLEQKRSKLELTEKSAAVNVIKPSSTEETEDQDMKTLRAKVLRSLSLDADNQKNLSEGVTSSGTPCARTPAFTMPRRNSLQDLCSFMASDSRSLTSQLTAASEAIKHAAVPMFKPPPLNLIEQAYQPFLKYSQGAFSKMENRTAASPSDFGMASSGVDPVLGRMGGASFSEPTERIAATKRASSFEDLKLEPSSTIRAGLSRSSEKKVIDLESMMEALGAKRERREREEPPNHLTVYKRHIITSRDDPSPKKLKRSQTPAPLNFCKLQFGEGDQTYFVTLVGLEMEKLMEIHTILNERRDSRMVKCGTSSEDLVDEIGDQMGVQLMMQKLQSLPPRGKYSTQELVNLSTSRFSHCKPDKWDEVMARFEREGIDGVLLRTEEVTHFKPSDYRQPDWRSYRNVDPARSIPERTRPITGRYSPA